MSCQKKHVRFVQYRKKVTIHPNLNTFVGLPVDSFFSKPVKRASKCQGNSYITGLIRNQFLYTLTGISASISMPGVAGQMLWI